MSCQPNITNITASGRCPTSARDWEWYERMLSVCIYTILLVGGCFGNLTIAWIILRHKRMHSATNWLVFNLAISGVAIAVITIPFAIIAEYIKWPFGVVGCKYLIMPVMEHFAGVCVLTHTAVGLARYSIVKNNRDISNKSVLVAIILIWSLAFFFLSGTLMGILGEFGLNEHQKCILVWYCRINGKRIYTFFVFPLTYVTPIVLTGFSYYRIRVISSSSLRRISHHLPEAMFISRQRKNRRMNAILMNMYFMFAITTLPYQIFLIIVHFEVLPSCFRYRRTLFYFLLALFYAQIITTPLVLFYMSIDYRRKIYDLPICCCVDTRKMRKLSLMVRQGMKEVGGEFKRKISSAGRKISNTRRFSEGRKVSNSTRKVSEGRKISNTRKFSDGRKISNTRKFSDGRKISSTRKMSEGRKISTARKISGVRYGTNRKISNNMRNGDFMNNHVTEDRRNSNHRFAFNNSHKNGRKCSSNGNILNKMNEMNEMNSIYTEVEYMKNTTMTTYFTIPEEDETKSSSNESLINKYEDPDEQISDITAQVYRKHSHPMFSKLTSKNINETNLQSNGVILQKMNQLNDILSGVSANKERRITSPDILNANISNKTERKWTSNESILRNVHQPNNLRPEQQNRVRKKAIIFNKYKSTTENENKKNLIEDESPDDSPNESNVIRYHNDDAYIINKSCINDTTHISSGIVEGLPNKTEIDSAIHEEDSLSHSTFIDNLEYIDITPHHDSLEFIPLASDYEDDHDGRTIICFYDPDFGSITFDHTDTKETDI